jgi:cellobiose-specific phosphotransferase system component IIC
MLVLLPSVSIGRRLLIVAIVIAAVWSVARLHAHFIPNVLINLGQAMPTPIGRVWPQIFSWFMTIAAAVVASFVYALLAGQLPEVIEWISHLFS